VNDAYIRNTYTYCSVSASTKSGIRNCTQNFQARFQASEASARDFGRKCIYLHLHFLTRPEFVANDERKCFFVTSLLQGAALVRLTPPLLKHLDEPRALFTIFALLNNELKKSFGPIDQNCTAEREISMFKQTNSATQYFTEFKLFNLLAQYLYWQSMNFN